MTYSIRTRLKAAALGASALVALTGAAQADQLILDDLIVDGSLCVGVDCVNGESFGFDTIRLKENNLRIKAQDTSTSASFPSNDWQITFNDSTNGGANKFSIDDIDNGRTPFTITAAARSNAIFVNSNGNVGFGTATPAVTLHARSGNTPTLRLEQDGSSGFAAQTWDVAGNETNFFVRDATNGSQLPLRIRPSAPSNSIFVNTNGEVVMGAASNKNNFDGNPAQLLVTGNSATKTGMIIAQNTGAAAERSMLELINNGGSYITLSDTANNDNWFITKQNADNGKLEFTSQLDGGGFVLATEMFPTGNMTIAGTLTQNSDKRNKMAIEDIDTGAILEKVAALPISSWTYKHDAATGVRHIGPMAQDFYALFGTGYTEKGISTIDTAGVALAAIQALTAHNDAQQALIDSLSARIETLEDHVVAD